MPRPLAIALVYAGLLSALVLLALVVIPISYAQILVLVGHTPEYLAWSAGVVRGGEGALRHCSATGCRCRRTPTCRRRRACALSAFISAAVASLGTIVVGAFTAMLIGVSALILSVFFLLQGSGVRDGILAFVPLRRRAGVGALLNELTAVFGHFVAGQVLLCAIVGAAVWLLLFPTHFAFALLVAVICAVGYAVPFVGMLVAQVAAALLAVPQGTGMVIWVTVAIFVVARVADNVLTPKIMEKSVGVSPITVMFAVFAGGELFGFPGLIFGIPAAALLKVLFGYFVQPYVVRMQSREAAAEPAVDGRSGRRRVKLGPP